MSTAIINIKTDPKIKGEAQKLASEMGLNLSTILNAFLKQFVRTKTVTFSIQKNQYPVFQASKETEQSMKDAMEHIDEAVDVDDVHAFFQTL